MSNLLRAPEHLWTLLRTGATFERTGAMREILDAFGVHGWPRFVIRAVARPFGLVGRRGDDSLPPVARAIQAMGPAYVKFGQILSTRRDIVGDEIVGQLRYLQDRLPPFSVEAARAEIESEFGPEIWEKITDFGEPVAAASIAQVHQATWAPTGEKVAVKVLRPGVRAQFSRDIGSFHFIAQTIERLVPMTRRLRPGAVVRHFESVVRAELDLRLEAAAASEYAEKTKSDLRLRIPSVQWEGTSRRILTLEWLEGTAMDPAALKAGGFNLPELASHVMRTFLRHALRDGFFHADMHQGNLRVAPNGDLIMLDFGIMGRLDPITRRHYAEILHGFLTRNYRRVAEVHFEAGYVPADRDVEQFAQALRAIGEPIFDQDASRISMAKVLAYLLETTERFGMETRTELILLQRTMVVVEGVTRTLDPTANIFNAAKPIVEEYIRDHLGPAAFARDTLETLRVLSRLGPRMPGLANELLMLAEEARTRRNRPPPDPTPKPRVLRWLLVGALLGVSTALLVDALI
ncbi:MAG: 2-polyprenylphenol 6-hydroxylase [Pseudomonadota bacterium]